MHGLNDVILSTGLAVDYDEVSADAERKIEPALVHQLQYALQMVMIEGTGASSLRYLPDSQRVAGKTGTTNDQRDSWFAGFSGDYLGVFWVGRDDNKPTPLTGATGALRLWSAFMAESDSSSIEFVQPDGLVYRHVNRADGQSSGEGCAGSILLPFSEGNAPREGRACKSGSRSDRLTCR